MLGKKTSMFVLIVSDFPGATADFKSKFSVLVMGTFHIGFLSFFPMIFFCRGGEGGRG